MITTFLLPWVVVGGAYLVGSLPTGYWIAQGMGINDIRRYGSGNIGATNVARFLGTKFFFIVFFLDCSKAYLYLTLCQWLGVATEVIMLSALVILIGNGCSLFLQGNGGKGVATMMGILLAISPLIALVSMAVWVLILWYVRVAGIASVISALILPALAAWYDLSLVVFISCMAVWILWRHRGNIREYGLISMRVK